MLRHNRRKMETRYELLVATHFVHRTYDIKYTFRKHRSHLSFGMWIIFFFRKLEQLLFFHILFQLLAMILRSSESQILGFISLKII